MVRLWPLLITCLLGACREAEPRQSPWANGTRLAYVQLESSLLEVSEVVGGLEVPWEVAMGPDHQLWFTEQKGTVSRVDLRTLERKTVLQIPDVHYIKSRGLLGMVLHPDFLNHPHVFLHYTFAIPQEDKLEKVMSRLVRYSYQGDTLGSPLILMDSIPGKAYHNGSRLAISSDLKLFFSLGDIGETDQVQNVNHVAGKIMRLNLDGSIPPDNPFPGNPVWSWGLRNPQGLAFATDGTLYASDHGPHNDDEINRIVKGGNYGWPDVQGFAQGEREIRYQRDSATIDPLKAWTPTLAVAGLDYYHSRNIPEWRHSLLVANLKGQALRVLSLNASGESIINEKIYFLKRLGRIRDLCVTPNGEVFMVTSNMDWHPRLQPWLYDSLPAGPDRIIRVRPVAPEERAKRNLTAAAIWYEDTITTELPTESWDYQITSAGLDQGERLYLQHCASCHREDGSGASDLIPPLIDTDWVHGDKTRLIRSLLAGLSEPIEVNGKIYEQEMPAFHMLTDEEIANVLSYIRRSFGNQAGVVIAGEVFEERKALGL